MDNAWTYGISTQEEIDAQVSVADDSPLARFIAMENRKQQERLARWNNRRESCLSNE